MASQAASDAAAQGITFDIFDGNIQQDATILVDKLTQEEKHEILNIIEEMDGANSREIIDFVSQECETAAATATIRHKVVSPEELDRLACKNSAESTLYQTNWAVRVIKGTISLVF